MSDPPLDSGGGTTAEVPVADESGEEDGSESGGPGMTTLIDGATTGADCGCETVALDPAEVSGLLAPLAFEGEVWTWVDRELLPTTASGFVDADGDAFEIIDGCGVGSCDEEIHIDGAQLHLQTDDGVLDHAFRGRLYLWPDGSASLRSTAAGGDLDLRSGLFDPKYDEFRLDASWKDGAPTIALDGAWVDDKFEEVAPVGGTYH